ncbi:retron Ec48 family effector membrane protein [Aeromonas veronii]|uniref:retron Ec48 family effector membrane protein n=1 Tax=Aeromonas veronii TaxID=654 RepID=UPI003D1EAFEC
MKKFNIGVLRKILLNISAVVVITFLIIGMFIFFNDLIKTKPCFSSACFTFFFDELEPAFKVLQAGGWLLTLLGTLGGAFLALKNYLDSIKHNAFNNHVNHIRLFSDFVNAELIKHSGISSNMIDIFHWYNVIFPHSSEGKMNASNEYFHIVDGIALEISASNRIIEKNANVYIMEHQERIHSKFSLIFGGKMGKLPKNDYLRVEAEIFSFIDKVNKTFVRESISLSNIERKYT